MNRKTERARLDTLKRDGDAALAKVKQEVEAARKAFEAWDAPRKAYLAAVQKLENETTRLTAVIDRGEAALRLDAEGVTTKALDMLNDMFQQERCGVERDNVSDKAARLSSIRKAITDIQSLCVSGEDVETGVERIMNGVLQLKWRKYETEDRPEKNMEDRFLERVS